jgi:hypothetical protein
LDCAVLVDDDERNVRIGAIADGDRIDEVFDIVAIDKSCAFAYADSIASWQA